MHVSEARLIYFSPTGTTRRTLEGIVRGIGVGQVDRIDLTLPNAETHQFAELHGELAFIGAPVYGGRIPIDAVRRLRQLEGNGTLAVIVVVYGNREYEDALLELRDLAVEAGFKPVAGGAFVGEHSFSSSALPIADGRPDKEDLAKAREFGTKIKHKLERLAVLDEMPPLWVPGSFPYKERGKPSRITPVTQERLCARCEECAAVCPTGAITPGNVVTTDPDACILCCACVKTCPSGARVMEDPRIKQSAGWLHANCQKRKEPEVFL